MPEEQIVCGWRDFGDRDHDRSRPLKAHYFRGVADAHGQGVARSPCGWYLSGHVGAGGTLADHPSDDRKCRRCATVENRITATGSRNG